MQNFITYEHLFTFSVYILRMNTFILHQLHYTLSCEVFTLIVSQFLSDCWPVDSNGPAIFCLTMDKFVDMCNEFQQHNSLDTRTETIWCAIFTHWWSSVFVAKTSIFKIIWRLVSKSTIIEARPGAFKTFEKKIFISARTSEAHKNHCYIMSSNWHIKFLIMRNVSFVLVESYYFVKQHPIGARKNNKPPLYNFGYNHTILN